MPGDQQLYKKLMSQGHSAAWDQEWNRAAEFYRLALEEFPDSVQATISRAAAFYEMGDLDAALELYRKVLARSPNDILVLEKIAWIFEAQGRHKAGAETALRVAEVHFKNGDQNKALENWLRTIRLDPKNLRARSRLAMHYEKQNQGQQAVTQYLVITSLLQHEGDKARAMEIIQYALKLQPRNPETQQALGLLRANQLLPLPDPKPVQRDPLLAAKPAPARLEAPRDAGPDRDDPLAAAEKKALLELAGLIFESDESNDNHQPARSLQSIAMGTGPLNRVQADQSRITMHLGQAVDLQARNFHAQAAEELERAIAIGLDHAAAYYDLGLLHHRDGSDDKAIRSLQTAVKHADYAMPSRLMLGRILLHSGRSHDSAVQYLEALHLADVLVIEDEQKSALDQIYETLIEAFSNDSKSSADEQLAGRIEQLLVQENWLERVRQLRQQLPPQTEGLPPFPMVELISQLQSSQVVDMLSHIHDLARTGYYRIAMEEAFIALQYAPTYLPLHTFMGEILAKQDRQPEAITKFSAVARAYSARGEAEHSIELFRRITRMAPMDLNSRQMLIEQLNASGRMEESVQEYLELGDVFYRLAELDRARETYQKALNMSQQAQVPGTWAVEILHHLADIDMQRLDWQRAVKIFEQIARIDPGDRKAAVGLVDLHFRLLNDKGALASLGNYVAFLNRKGRQHEVLETLELLAANNPDEIHLKSTLAEQYQLAGNKDRAIEIWDEVGNQLLTDEDIPGARQAIEAILALDPPNAADYRLVLQSIQQK